MDFFFFLGIWVLLNGVFWEKKLDVLILIIIK